MLADALKAVDPAVLIHKNNPAPDEDVALIEAVIIQTPGDKVILDKVEGVARATEEYVVAIVPDIIHPKLPVPVPVVALYGVVAVGRVIPPPIDKIPVDGTNDNAEAVFKGNPPDALELLTNGI